jgi:hypothetical protein
MSIRLNKQLLTGKNIGSILHLMKKFGIIIIVLVLLAIAGYFGYTQFKGSKSTNPSNVVTEGAKAVGGAVKGTIQDLLTSGKSVTCAVSDEAAGGGTGTIFVSGKRMAGDFTTDVDGKKVVGHMITDGTYSYIWSSDQTEGIKMKIDEIKITPGAEGNGQPTSAEVFDLKKQTGLKCSPWSPDSNKFNPPTNIKFSDLTEMMKGFTQPKTTGKTTTQQGSVCDQIPDATAKAECVKALQGQGQ